MEIYKYPFDLSVKGIIWNPGEFGRYNCDRTHVQRSNLVIALQKL